jgi:hypothetical protein
MKTTEEILDEINTNEDWYRSKRNNKIIRKYVDLSLILDDSSTLIPSINIRSLNTEKVKTIQDDIIANKGVVTPAMAMKYGNGRYCVLDGNHKQMAVKLLCKELGPEKCKKFGFNALEIQVLKGSPKKADAAWRAFCISYRMNRDATTLEKVLAIGYGWEHYGEKDVYSSRLVKEFGEKSDDISRHKQAYVKLKKLSLEKREAFMETYKYKRITIKSVNNALDLLLAEEKDKPTVREPKKDGDPLIGSIVNSVKKAEVIIDELLVDDSGYYIHEAKLDNIIGFLKKVKEQIHDEGETHDIHILNNNHYSNLKSSEEKLKEGMEKKSEVIIKLIEIRKLVHGIMMEAKRGNNH